LDYKKSKNNIYRILEKINDKISEKNNEAWYSQDDELYDLENLLNEIKSRKIKNNLIFILTDKTDFDLNKLKFLNRDNDIIIINIFDKFELSLLKNENISLNLWDKKEFLNIDLKDTKKIEKYENEIIKKIDKLKYDLERNNIWYILINNESDIVKELLKYFTQIVNRGF
jgi:hypothetical protein